MRVTVEGLVTDVWEKNDKHGKPITEILLAQDGEREQTLVRLEGSQADMYQRYEKNAFTGRLVAWVSRGTNVGTMVMA